jgi:hypothetical protein
VEIENSIRRLIIAIGHNNVKEVETILNELEALQDLSLAHCFEVNDYLELRLAAGDPPLSPDEQQLDQFI